MNQEKIVRKPPKIPLASLPFSLPKVRIPLVKISTVLTVFETLKIIDFQGGIPTPKNETKTRQVVLLECFTRLFLHA